MTTVPLAAPPPVGTPRTHDDEPRRSTYGVAYPLGADAHVDFAAKDDVATKIPPPPENSTKRHLRARWLTFTLRLRSFEDVVFEACNFHDRHGLGVAEISELTFRRCDFRRCFFGTTRFHRVRFVDCTFEHCDFSRDEFDQCTFEDCTFSNSSAWHAVFRYTDVDPDALLQGTPFPASSMADKTDNFRESVRREWLHARLRLAEQLFRSNTEAMHPEFSDSALRAMKAAAHKWKWDLWWHGGLSTYAAPRLATPEALRRAKTGPLFAFGRALLLHATGAGTSIRRLALVLIGAAALYPILLINLPISHAGVRCTPAGPMQVFDYIRLSVLSVSLLLGFGFTAFSADGLTATAALVAAPLLGAAWYALLISVLVRRIYR